jgi:hypothetical protein
VFGTNKPWRDLTTTQKAGMVLLSAVQITLLVAALTDLRRRSADEINGSKQLWTALAFVNVIVPMAYFVFGRKR